MREHVRSELVSLSLLSVSELIVDEGLLRAVILVGVGLVRVSPVSRCGHDAAISLLGGKCRTFSVEFLHHALICTHMSFIAHLGLAFESTRQMLLGLPSLRSFLVTVEASSTMITTSKVLPSDFIRLGTSKHVAAPVLFAAGSDWMVQGAIFLFDGRFIISDNVRPSESIRLPHAELFLIFGDSSTLHNLAAAFGTKDIRVLIRLARRTRLNGVRLELAVSNLLLLVLHGHWVVAWIGEVEVRLESVGGSGVFDSIMRVDVGVSMQVGTSTLVVAISCEHI